MHYADLFETLMLTAFSLGWYLSIFKMLRVCMAFGKSAGFVTCVVVGYGFGVAAKLLRAAESGMLQPVIWVYCWNFLVCLLDLALVLYFTRRARNLSTT